MTLADNLSISTVSGVTQKVNYFLCAGTFHDSCFVRFIMVDNMMRCDHLNYDAENVS